MPVWSAYWWNGKIEETEEVMMVLKTIEKNFEKIEGFLINNSGYTVPEVLAIKPDKASSPYLKWLISLLQ